MNSIKLPLSESIFQSSSASNEQKRKIGQWMLVWEGHRIEGSVQNQYTDFIIRNIH